MCRKISLIERSKANESLVYSILNNQQSNFYECTIHNMYYSVYQRMKALLCLKSNYTEDDYIPHNNRKIDGEVVKKGILDLCKDYILALNYGNNNVLTLSKVSTLYLARIMYDYRKVNHIDKIQYKDYYDMMKEVNNYLDQFIY